MTVPLPRRVACLTLVVMSLASWGGAQSSGVPAGGQPARSSTGWTLVFADEFDRAGAPDPSKWGYETGYIRNREAQYYTSRRENVRVEDGHLVIEARREAYEGYAYTSASLNTQGRFEFLYGKVEVRAKLPSGKGAWPAAWMLGVNREQIGWPACGEIDIMENVGFDPLRIYGSIHTTAYNHTIGTQKTAAVMVEDPSAAFHVYTMEWSPERIEISVDGDVYFTFRNEGSGNAAWPFDKSHYLLLNLAVGGSWGGQQGIDDSRFPMKYVIDYVRIYQKR